MGSTPLRVALAGLGGFAHTHHEALRDLESQGVARLVATCDPTLTTLPHSIEEELIAREARFFPTLEELLARTPDLDWVCLPTPIPFHADQHKQVIEAGAACYLEKPPTLWLPELHQMLEVEKQAKRATNVGFNFVGDPFRRELKQRAINGEFGPLTSVRLFAHWPRTPAYYLRNNWAGKRFLDGKPVMDSPIGNACAHFVQNLLWMAGQPSLDHVANIVDCEAETFRAYDIESYDTVFLKATLQDQIQLKLAVSHTLREDSAGEAQSDLERYEYQRATIEFPTWRSAKIVWKDGSKGEERIESSWRDYRDVTRENFLMYAHYLGGASGRPITTLQDSESFVRLCHASQHTPNGIQNFPQERVQIGEGGKRSVTGLEEEMRAFVLG